MKKMERLALSSKIRIAMLQVLCDKNNGLEVSDYEVKNKDSIHTYKTLNYFKDKYPEADIYFLNGADKLTSIPKWNNAEELVRDIRFVLFDRADLDADSIIRSMPLLNEYSDHFTILPATEGFSDVSSSKICEMFENGDSSYRALMDADAADVLAQTFNSAVSGDEAICDALLQGGFTQWIMENSRNYFELDEYVFVHGYIPLCKGKYDENWRAYPTEKWGGARKTGAVKAILKEGVRIPEKTVVCGHVGAYYGHVKEKNPTVEFDSPAFKKLAAKIRKRRNLNYDLSRISG